jgi:N-acetylglutamate synthase-like GNAT family acetyltransferase
MYAEMRFGKQQFIPKYMPSKASEYQYREVEKMAEKIKWIEAFRRGYKGELHPFSLKLCNEANRFIVIVVNSKDAGFVRLSPIGRGLADACSKDIMELADAYIKPPYRNNYVFRTFIQELIVNYGVKSIMLTEYCYFENQEYYNQLGFTKPIEIETGLYRVFLGSFMNALEQQEACHTLH